MARIIGFAMAMVLLGSAVSAAIPANYYNSANTGSAAALRSSLNDIVTAGHNRVGYSNSWDPIKRVDTDPNNSSNVILMYTGQSRAKSANCTVSGCEDGSASTGLWTREHIWPQSSFDSNEPMRSDLHALFAIDQDVNNQRGNKPFDYVATPTYTAFGSEGNSTRWEPRPADRGNVARAMFYMDIRYEGEGGNPNLTLNNNPSTANNAGQSGILSTLLQWHIDDPVDANEIARNARVYDEQGNANPFIDHPEWVAIVYGTATVSDGDTLNVASVNRAPAEAIPGEEVPMLSLNLSANTNQWDISSISVSNTGTVPDTNITAVKIYRDTDNSGTVTVGDVLQSSGTFSSGSATLNMSNYRLGTATTNFLLTLTTNAGSPASGTLGLQVNTNGITHSATGGNDVDPMLAAIPSGTTNIISPVTGEIIISEIMYNPNSAEPAGEWVEIFNNSITASTLTGWRLQDEDGQTGTFTATLAAGEAAVIIPSTTGAAAFHASWGTGFQVIEVTGWANLNNLGNSPTTSDEILTLRNTNGDVIDEVNYDDAAPWPVDDGTASIMVVPTKLSTTDNDNGANWNLSAIGTYGGRANTATATFGNDIGSPGYVSVPPAIGFVSTFINEDTPGPVIVTFIDLNDPVPGAFTPSITGLSSGSATGLSVNKTGSLSYEVQFNYTPAANANGNVTFNLSINDGDTVSSISGLSFTINAVNDNPTISNITSKTTDMNVALGPINFTIGDVETLASDLALSAFSSNETLVPTDNIVFGGSGPNRTVTITPATNQTGTANITVFVEDEDGALGSTTFLLTVTGTPSSVGHWWIIE